MKRQLTVITDARGKVIVTREGHGETIDPASGIRFSIVAGPDQKLHEIEFDVPQRLSRSADIEAFHSAIANHLATGRKAK
jgi:hypothetical protein